VCPKPTENAEVLESKIRAVGAQIEAVCNQKPPIVRESEARCLDARRRGAVSTDDFIRCKFRIFGAVVGFDDMRGAPVDPLGGCFFVTNEHLGLNS